MNGGAWIFASVLLSLTVLHAPANQPPDLEWVDIPGGRFILGSREPGAAHPPEAIDLPAFSLSAREISVEEFCSYLNDSAQGLSHPHPQIEFSTGRFRPLEGLRHEPLAFASYPDAMAFCVWLDGLLDAEVRLPTPQEWEAAARGGIGGGRYPWGWGDPLGRANFASEGARAAGSYPANGYGLFDMAGNLFEWCRSAESEAAPARGGSWAENDPKLLRVFSQIRLPKEYRGADVGFRVVAIHPGEGKGDKNETAAGHRQQKQDQGDRVDIQGRRP